MHSFKRPYYVSTHAVTRFREYVRNLSTREVRRVIQDQLQDATPISGHYYNNGWCHVYRCKHNAVVFYVVVTPACKNKTQAWPEVPTLFAENMDYSQEFINARNRKGQRKHERVSK